MKVFFALAIVALIFIGVEAGGKSLNDFNSCTAKLSCTCSSCGSKCSSINKNEDECKYIKKNASKYNDKKWSDEFGENWHGCYEKCLDKLSGSDKKCLEKIIDCGSNIINITLVMVAVAFMALF